MRSFKRTYTTVFQTLFRINDSQKRCLSVIDVLVFNYVCIDENKMLSSTKVGWKFPIICFCLITFQKPVCIWIHFVPHMNSVTVRNTFKANDAGDFFTGKCNSLIISCKNSYFPELLIALKEKWGHPTVPLTVARSCATVSDVLGIKASFCPL